MKSKYHPKVSVEEETRMVLKKAHCSGNTSIPINTEPLLAMNLSLGITKLLEYTTYLRYLYNINYLVKNIWC